MTSVSATPRATRNLSILIGTDEYNLHVSNVVVEPTQLKWKGGTPGANFIDETWMLSLTLVHDYQNASSLYNFMLDHAGETATFTYMPDATATFARSVTATIVSPAIGGKVDAFNESTVKMDCSEPIDASES